MKVQIDRQNQQGQRGFFININKIDKTLARETRKERKKLNKQKMEDKDIDVPDLKNNEKPLWTNFLTKVRRSEQNS